MWKHRFRRTMTRTALIIRKCILVCPLPGKFMMQVLPPCGHAVQEDKPDKVRKQVIKLECMYFNSFKTAKYKWSDLCDIQNWNQQANELIVNMAQPRGRFQPHWSQRVSESLIPLQTYDELLKIATQISLIHRHATSSISSKIWMTF